MGSYQLAFKETEPLQLINKWG